MPPLRTLTDGSPFLRSSWFGAVRGVYHQMLIWVTDECLSLLRYNGHCFIDGTFKTSPSPFKQCVIIMTFDRGTHKYIPCVYALLTGKNEYLYRKLFSEIISLLEYRWMPSIITVDFERSLISSVKREFPQSRITGCYFHLKQALFRKLTKICCDFNLVGLILSKIELLTVIPLEEISMAIRYLKEILPQTDTSTLFWQYFENTWIRRYDPSLWNISTVDEYQISGRTNNCLERYNRRLNDFFANAHPNIASFVTVIRNEFEFYSQVCAQVRQNSTSIDYGQGIFDKPAVAADYMIWKLNI
ncbi:hypothetical protein RF11_05144 [Thelohanellus kitauei]|uniref:MULE transposase domain-containing protein n=2 Tax=Thelohanellus kitauei TaxID=669202 RepID=A0A0C2JDU0_THEKT|nr:hypothetical protein RF11_05144 [Thelohanellus kitauei]